MQEIAAIPAQALKQVSDQKFDAVLVAALGGPERLASIARRLPTLVWVQESFLDLMALKGDFVHWVSMFRMAKRIVFLTERQKDKTFASFTAGLDDKSVVLACGAPADIGKLRVPVEKEHFSVVMHAPVLPHKRQQDLIAVGERLRDYNLSFTFIGENQGLAAMPEGMRKIVERHPDRYNFVGYQTGAQTRALLAKSDLYVHTSSDEAWPQSVIDAAAMGMPLMLSEIEAFSKLWVHGVNCLKFPTNNPDFLASSCAWFCKTMCCATTFLCRPPTRPSAFPSNAFTAPWCRWLRAWYREFARPLGGSAALGLGRCQLRAGA